MQAGKDELGRPTHAPEVEDTGISPKKVFDVFMKAASRKGTTAITPKVDEDLPPAEEGIPADFEDMFKNRRPHPQGPGRKRGPGEKE